MSSHVLALDVGTSSVRALLFGQRARQVPGAWHRSPISLGSTDLLPPDLAQTFAPQPPATETYARQLRKQENLYRLLIEEQGLDSRPLTELLAEQAAAHLS
jgi:glycerol kinase